MSDLHYDGWSNILTGLGRRGKDKRVSLQATWERLSRYDVEAIYAVDDAAEKVVDDVVDEAFRKEVKFTHDNDDGSFNKEMHDYLKEIHFFDKFTKAAKQGRLYGGAIMLFGINDGQDPDEEVNYDAIRSVDWFEVIHRWDLTVLGTQSDVSKEGFKDPLLYSFVDASISESDLAGILFHSSRAVRLDGAKLPNQLYENNNYFHDSVLTKFLNPLQNWNSAYDSVATLLQDFAAGVFKMKGLAKLVGAGMDEAVMKRLSLIDMKRSLVKSVVVDAEEDFERKATPLTGIKDVLERMDNRLTSASRMPHTRLLGQGATGNLSGSGESEEKNWHDYVKTKQMGEYKPKMLQALKILLSAKNNPITKGKWPKGFDVDFPPVKEMNEKDQADIYLKRAQGDQIYIMNQVLDPDEVAVSRFSDDSEIKIEVENRSERLTEGEEGDNIEPQNIDPNTNRADSSLSDKERTPPKSAQNNGKKVLEWREKYPDEVKGMTEVGWRRANQLASGEPLSMDVISRMAQFERHRENSKVSSENKSTPWKDNGRVSWLGWGGDTGIAWAQRMVEKAKNGDK